MLALLVLPLLALGGCNPGVRPTAFVRGDGSSTVAPLMEAIAEEFEMAGGGVGVQLGTSGTGGGFTRFIAGETDFNNGSRSIRAAEIEACERAGVEFIELPLAYDGLTVLVHPRNQFVDHFTVEELRALWEPGSTVRRWSQLRPEWPDREIGLFGPGTDSGTFDYFTEAIVGREKASRSDYQMSEDDHFLVLGIAGTDDSLGYLGYSYYHENRARLRAVPVDGGSGPVEPTLETIRDGSYTPLARPLFVYVRRSAAERLEVQQFVDFMLTYAADLAELEGFVPLSEEAYALTRERFERRITGTMFTPGTPHIGVQIEELLARGAGR